MADLKLIETGDGGDLVINEARTDLVMIEGFENMPYLGMFGGNIESNTQEFKEGEQRLDWWGNNLLMNNQSKIQFNSNLERLLNNVVLNSSSRILIEEAVKTDLSFMSDFAIVTVAAFIESSDRVEITINIDQPDNLQSNQFIYLWDSTQGELELIKSS